MTGGLAWVDSAVLEALVVDADEHAPNETGGLLLGYRYGATEIVISDAIGPGPCADHRRKGFDPDSHWQANELARRYKAAGRQLHYLGDWHTHPRGTPTLSRTDHRTLQAIARDPAARCPQPVMAVLAGGDPWTLLIRQPAAARLRRRTEALTLRSFSA